MCLDRVDDVLRLAVPPRELRRDRGMRPLDLVCHRLADVVQHRRALRRLRACAQLRRHDAREVHDLERVLEDVLPVARAEAQPAENLHELVVERSAVRLEHGLLAGLPYELLELGLRLVVGLFDPRRMDAAVLDQLRQRQARRLAAEPVERREHDCMRRFVDDEVYARQMLERADVSTFTPDDAAFHVVGRKLDDGDGRLRGVTRCDALERVGDEVACTPLRLRLRFLLEHPDAPGEVVTQELLAALEQMRLRLLLREPGDPLELGLLGELRLLQLLLQPPEVRLAVREALVAPRQLDELPLDLLFLREDTLFDLEDGLAPVSELAVDLRPERDRLLARRDMRLAPDGLGLAVGVLEQLPPQAAGLADAGRAEHLHGEQRNRDPCDDSDCDSDPDQHARLLGWVAPPGTDPAARIAESRVDSLRARIARAPRAAVLPGRDPPSSEGGTKCRHHGCRMVSEVRKNAICRQMSGEA